MRWLLLPLLVPLAGCALLFPSAPVTCATANLRDNPEMFQKYAMVTASGDTTLVYWVCVDR